jgi:hypothetical protein
MCLFLALMAESLQRLCENKNIQILSFIKKECIFVAVIQTDMSFIKPTSREQLMMPSSVDE